MDISSSLLHGPVVNSMTALPKSLCFERLLFLFYPLRSTVWLHAPHAGWARRLSPVSHPNLPQPLRTLPPTSLSFTPGFYSGFSFSFHSRLNSPRASCQQGMVSAAVFHSYRTTARCTRQLLSSGITTNSELHNWKHHLTGMQQEEIQLISCLLISLTFY